MATGSGGNGTDGRDLCLLSLDGGGIRGLSSLLIIRQLMESINQENPPRPCNYFDMICGTSTGGLIAIMLGRLKMSVEDCIAEYRKLSPEIFVKKNHRLDMHGHTQGRFDSAAFERRIKEMLQERGFGQDELLKETVSNVSQRDCKVLVCTTTQFHTDPVIFSNYSSKRRNNNRLKIAKVWEVARATSAAPTFFDPVNIGGEIFGDGAMGANNPIQQLWAEAMDVFGNEQPGWKLEDHIQCLVSIGTGKLLLERFGTSVIKGEVHNALVAIATDTEAKANNFEIVHRDLFERNCAFRFNVEQGLEEVALQEHSKMEYIASVTERYIASQRAYQLFQKCVKQLEIRGWLTRLEDLFRQRAQVMNSFAEFSDSEASQELFESYSHTSVYENWLKEGFCLQVDDSAALLPLAHGMIGSKRNIKRKVPELYSVRCAKGQRDAYEGFLIKLMSQALHPPNRPGRIDTMVVKSLDEKVVADLRQLSIYGPRSQEHLLDIVMGVFAKKKGAILLVIDGADQSHGDLLQLFFSACVALRRIPIRVLITDTLGKFDKIQTARIRKSTEYEECRDLLSAELDQNTRKTGIADAISDSDNWIWSQHAYRAWSEQTSGILLIQGKAGSGKSVLAKSISNRIRDELPPRKSGKAKLLTSEWFYSTRNGDVAQKHQFLLQAILSQWLDQRPSLFKFVSSVSRKYFLRSTKWVKSTDKIKKILLSITHSGLEFVTVIDGMDESEDVRSSQNSSTSAQSKAGQRQAVLQTLKELVSKKPGSRAKFILLTRPLLDIELEFPREKKSNGLVQRIIMEHETKGAIRMIVDDGLRTLAGVDRRLGEEVSKCDLTKYDPMRRYLEDNANGVILWVTLVLIELQGMAKNGMSDVSTLERTLHNMPQDLTEFYKYTIERLLEDCSPGVRREKVRQARYILLWVSGSPTALGRPISLGGLDEARRLNDTFDDQSLAPSNLEEVHRCLHEICGPFLEVQQQKTWGDDYHRNDVVQLTHRTAKDFLEESDVAGELAFTDDDAKSTIENAIPRYLTSLERGLVMRAGATNPNSRKRSAPNPPKHDSKSMESSFREVLGFLESRTLLKDYLRSPGPSDRKRKFCERLCILLAIYTSEVCFSGLSDDEVKKLCPFTQFTTDRFMDGTLDLDSKKDGIASAEDISLKLDLDVTGSITSHATVESGKTPPDLNFVTEGDSKEHVLHMFLTQWKVTMKNPRQLRWLLSELVYWACVLGFPGAAAVLMRSIVTCARFELFSDHRIRAIGKLTMMAVNQAGIDSGLKPVFPLWLEYLGHKNIGLPKQEAYYNELRSRDPRRADSIVESALAQLSQLLGGILVGFERPTSPNRMSSSSSVRRRAMDSTPAALTALEGISQDLKHKGAEGALFAKVCEAMWEIVALTGRIPLMRNNLLPRRHRRR